MTTNQHATQDQPGPVTRKLATWFVIPGDKVSGLYDAMWEFVADDNAPFLITIPLMDHAYFMAKEHKQDDDTTERELARIFDSLRHDKVVTVRPRHVPWYQTITRERIAFLIDVMERHGLQSLLADMFGEGYRELLGCEGVSLIAQCEKCGQVLRERSEAKIVGASKVLCGPCYERVIDFVKWAKSVTPPDAKFYSEYLDSPEEQEGEEKRNALLIERDSGGAKGDEEELQRRGSTP